MAITPSDVVERTISALENSTSGDFSNIRGKLYEKARQIEIDLCHGTSGGGTSGAALPLPHTLASFVWYLPLCQQTPITQPYTFPVLRPIASGCLIEAFVEVGAAASGGDITFEFYKNNDLLGTAVLPSGDNTVTIPISGTLAEREFTRDDFVAFKVIESVTSRARFMTVYLRFFQYPYIMADTQSPMPIPV